jgi:hypothetical protein
MAMKHDRCWARKFDDCSDKLSREHLVSNVAWPGKDRASRDKHPITSQAGIYRAGTIDTSVPGGYLRQQTVAGLTKKVLCTHHNSALSSCDDAAGELTRALDLFWKACLGRPYASLSYTDRTYTVDGLRLQRWFMKTAITFAVDGRDPIGGSDAEVGSPTDELVDVAFGHKPAFGHMGLWTLDAPPQAVQQLNGFSFGLWRRVFDDVRGQFRTIRVPASTPATDQGLRSPTAIRSLR